MKVDIEYILHLRAELKKINSVELEEIDFYKNGKKLNISKQQISDFKFVGLDNDAFITYEYYLGNIDEN